MTRRYFDDEMRYLHEAGKAFAEAHPEAAPYLNIDSVADRDPYVERLFEGFAFLTGRIRRQLDGELPQYTESLCRLLYPHFLRPIPALSLVAFRPRPGEVQGTTTLAKGTEVRSGPVGEEQTTCRFVTTQAVRLQPIELQQVELSWNPDGTTRASLLLSPKDRADVASLDLSPLRLHFHADPAEASVMHLFCTRHVRKVVLSDGPSRFGGPPLTGSDAGDESAVTLRGQQWVRPGGLDRAEGLLPYSRHSFSGFRLLQEYLAFRQKFWCVDLYGLDRFTPSMASNTLQVQLFFDRPYPEEKRFRKEHVRLFCTPVVNLFEQDAEPIRVEHQRAEYRVAPDLHHPASTEVYDVRRGVGLEERTGQRRAYRPFYTFDEGENEDGRSFTTTSRAGPQGRRETYISLHPAAGEDAAPVVDSLSLEVRCTNGSLPREKLQERMMDRLAPEGPAVAEPANLTQPTLIRYPPTGEQQAFFWKLISHWSLNYQTLARREALVELLRLYDWSGADANRRRIAGLRDVSWEPKDVMHRGAVLRGAEVTLKIQEGHFADEGDVCLFGLVMSTFFSLYATINSFVHLTIEMAPSGKTYRWTPKSGKQPLL